MSNTNKTNSNKITCVVTGKQKTRNSAYLAKYAAERNTTVEDYKNFYACREAVKMLRKGKTVEEVREALQVPAEITREFSAEDVSKILQYNGRQATKVDTKQS